MLQLIKYEGNMFYRDQLLSKIKQAAKHMYLVYQNLNYNLLLILFMMKCIFIIIT